MLALLASGCARTDPEQALRETVAQLQSAIEERDPAAMQQHLAEDFIGNDGLDRDGARRLAGAMLLRYRDLAIDAGPLQVDIDGTHAVVRFTAVLRGGSGRLLPESARVYEVETGWRLQQGDWRLTSARWTPTL
ncbi:nuclear transport factor 2 family protein [Luteimonas kalidii]|uniref:Nuclear transport factor 2 family protein n=1 Tax=Luteimonas kalidii TaxID=3042025 RepID=A0ABT6JTC3_9GAMM|nr:nuclear transport factor 2 family protein [Luteimonas kalidii]MDH5833728.1 nuclear transport factor 2 family protein [Luteimonas kalidii]